MVKKYSGKKRLKKISFENKTSVSSSDIHVSYTSMMTKHERLRLGCYLSHVTLWEEMLSEGMPYLVVLEDDVILHAGFKVNLLKMINSLPDNWDLFYLDGCYVHYGPFFSPGVRLSRGGLCTSSYVISEKAAIYFMYGAALHSDKPVDHMMSDEVLSGRLLAFHSDPPLSHTNKHIQSTLAYLV